MYMFFIISGLSFFHFGFRIIAVGITTSVDPDELNSIASDADFVVLVEDFDALENYFDEVLVRLCDVDPGSGSSKDCCKSLLRPSSAPLPHPGIQL